MFSYKASLLFFVLAAVTGSGLAAPAPTNDLQARNETLLAHSTLAERDDQLTWHYLCIDANWEACDYFQYNINVCNRLEPTWAKRISSWDPPKGVKCYGYGGSYCKHWKPEDCHADTCWKDGGNPVIGPVRHPGINSLAGWQHGDINWNDRMGSFICYLDR